MIPMTNAMRTLLKSKVMVGDNRPTYEVTISGAPTGGEFDWTLANTVVEPDTGANELANTSMSAVKLADGRVMAVYVRSDLIYQAFADSVDDFIFTDGSLSDEAEILASVTGKSNTRCTVFWTPAGDLMLVYSCLSNTRKHGECKVYKSPLGDGADWEYLSTIRTLDTSYAGTMNATVFGLPGIGTPLFLDDGRAVLIYPKVYFYSGSASISSSGDWAGFITSVAISDDNCVSWTSVYEFDRGSGRLDSNSVGRSRNIGLIDGDLWFTTTESAADHIIYFHKSSDNGSTWTVAFYPTNEEIVPGEGVTAASAFCFSDTENLYIIYRDSSNDDGYCNIFECSTSPAAYTDLVYSGHRIQYLGHHVTDENNLVLCDLDGIVGFMSSATGCVDYVASLEVPSVPLKVKSIDVEMTKGMASQATILLDNKAGLYSPDKAGDYYQILWPNHVVTVKVGYGSAGIQQVFTGLIDSISMRAGLAEIQLNCRDMLKWALDQQVAQVADTVTYYNIYYEAQTAEYIFIDLATRAGWAPADIINGITGVTLSIAFSHESYADAFQRLCELTGFEFYTDYAGKIYFVQATDRQPMITAANVTLNGTTAAEITGIPAGNPMVDGSVVVMDSGRTVTYTKDTDYTVVLGGSTTNASITRIAGGLIADGQVVSVDCVYAGWVFKEGQDITSLDYTISDQEVQARVIVLAQDTGESYCRGDYDFGGVQYYNVLAGKVQIIDVGEIASTNAQCAVIAQRTGLACLTKVRQANFEAVGNPYIQTGDCVQVIETSTTISEVYRAYALRHHIDPGNFLTTLETYHYGYAPV